MKKIFILALCLLAVAGCQTKYIPIGDIHVDSIYSSLAMRDSIVVRDSIYVCQRGDTVFKIVSKDVYRDRIVIDTFLMERTDTIVKVIEVERQLSWWERVKEDIENALSGLALIAIAFYFFKIK